MKESEYGKKLFCLVLDEKKKIMHKKEEKKENREEVYSLDNAMFSLSQSK